MRPGPQVIKFKQSYNRFVRPFVKAFTAQLLLLGFLSPLTLSTVRAQSDSLYQTLIAGAGLFHLQENHKRAVNLYEKAFQLQQPDALTAYKAAGMYSLDSNAEKAFQYLEYALSSGWAEADWLAFDPYFDYLRNAYPQKMEGNGTAGLHQGEAICSNPATPVTKKRN